MLSTTTKQINAYGKRSKRVIDAPIGSETAKPVSSTLVRIFDDLPPPSTKSGLASRMKKRENKLPSPKPVGKQAKKKRISPISPFKKPNRVNQLIQEDACANTNTPARAPLSSFSVNLPASPAAMPSPKHKAPIKSIPIKLAKPKVVSMDIILLDDEGHTVGKERRVSRTGVTPKPAKVAPKAQAKLPLKPVVYVDSDCEDAPSHPVPPKRSQKRRPVVASDSESETDVQLPSRPPSPLPHKKPAIQPAKPLRRQTTVEVVVPPAPYRIPSLGTNGQRPVAAQKAPTKPLPVKTALPSKLQPAASPPKPKPVPAVARPPPAFQLPPSPIQKARPLTPIRGRRKGLFDPPSPSSPSLSDCDLSLYFSELAIDDGSEAFTQVDQSIPEHLLPLLEECGQDQCGPHDFSSFIDTFPFDPILQKPHSSAFEDMQFRKIGEASYSEVFGIGDVVLKVIPLRDESKKTPSSSKSRMEMEEGPPPSDAQDVRKEIIVTRAMGEVYGGFVKFLKTYIVKGKYPELLLQLWDEYDKSKGSESIRPDTFKLSQVYAIIVLPNGGPDLESYAFTHASKFGWRKACSIFWQVAKSLAHAEHLVSFEHRDLHWGQVLVKNVTKPKLKSIDLNGARSRKRKPLMDDISHGVQTTIIDLGLSRMDAGDGDDGNSVHWTPFDEEVFMGEYQYDIYRMMRAHVGKDWEGYHPLTNVMWLHYLSTKLIRAKGLKAPRKSKAQTEEPLPPVANEDFSEQDCYEALLDVEQWLGAFLSDTFGSTQKVPKGKPRRKTMARPQQQVLHGGPVSAGEIIQYGVKKGWISATVLY